MLGRLGPESWRRWPGRVLLVMGGRLRSDGGGKVAVVGVVFVEELREGGRRVVAPVRVVTEDLVREWPWLGGS